MISENNDRLYICHEIQTKRSGLTAPIFILAPSARLEHATYCSASKRSNPLSYEGKQGGILTRLDTMVKSMEHVVNC